MQVQQEFRYMSAYCFLIIVEWILLTSKILLTVIYLPDYGCKEEHRRDTRKGQLSMGPTAADFQWKGFER